LHGIRTQEPHLDRAWPSTVRFGFCRQEEARHCFHSGPCSTRMFKMPTGRLISSSDEHRAVKRDHHRPPRRWRPNPNTRRQVFFGHQPDTKTPEAGWASGVCEASGSLNVGFWLRGQDLNLGPSGYEPDELPGCSTPRWCVLWAPGEGPERCPPSASPGLAGAFGDAARLLSRRNQGCGGCRAGLEGLAATYSSAP
jgi:hypothetical protein